MLKLYTAYSVVNDFRGRNHVTFVWYCHQRPAPVANYADAIAQYTALADQQQQGKAQRHLDALFTEEEIRALRAYLGARHDAELFSQRVELPIGLDKCRNWSSDGTPVEHGTGIYQLSKEQHYDLPFDVWASYDLRDCPLTAEAEREMKQRQPGVSFLQEALAMLGCDAGIDERCLDRAVAQLYASGYCVTQSCNPPEAIDPSAQELG